MAFNGFILNAFHCLLVIRAGGAETQDDNTILCYSCTGVPPKFRKYDESGLLGYMASRKIRIPVLTAACGENYVLEPKKNKDLPRQQCASGLCVKLKGVFQEETFVVRECWNRLWDRDPEYDYECGPLELMGEAKTDFCVCSTHDLCNAAAAHGSITLLIILVVFVTYIA